MRISLLVFVCQLLITTCCGQPNRNKVDDLRVGGPCEGCEALYEYEDKVLNAVDTIDSFEKETPKIKVTGAVYNGSGQPVPNVIIYAYHTDRNGRYTPSETAEGWGRRHGALRGWARSDKNGRYTFYTVRPGAYPGGSEPEHIHLTVKEEGMTPYYISDIVFDDDPLMTEERRRKLIKRGGSGLVNVQQYVEYGLVERDIFLGRNIPGHPNSSQ